jgi:hypothetical protein
VADSRDWDALTRAWVAEGLVEASKRETLLERLTNLPVESAVSSGLPVGPIVTLLVAGATWMLVGAAVAIAALLHVDDSTLLGLLLTGCAGATAILGGLLRLVPAAKPVARGLLAAAPPVGALGVAAFVGHAEELDILTVIPGVAGIGIALLDGSRSQAATSSVSVGIAALGSVIALRHRELAATAALPAAVIAIAAVALLARFWKARSEVLEVLVPAGVLFVAGDVFVTGTHFGPIWHVLRGLDHPWWLEKSLELLATAGALVLAGAVARSGWTLVPAVMLVAVATISLASSVGSWIGGAIALVLVAGLFLFLAAGLWIARSRTTGAPRPEVQP